MTILLFSTTALVSAFLLFLIQPMIGKFLLPLFGGAPLVWTVCMMFFQAALLAGYAYAHVLRTKFPRRLGALTHGAVLACGAVCARFLPDAQQGPLAEASPILELLRILSIHVAVPYFALSATAPLTQWWFHQYRPDRSPYPLYAVSNVGSLLAVIAYPFVFEPLLSLSVQETIFQVVYFAFAGLSATSMLLGLKTSQGNRVLCDRPVRDDSSRPFDHPEEAEGRLEGRHEKFRQPWKKPAWAWFFLSALGVMLLLSTTEHISRNVAVSSVFWMTPMCLYLLSFIVCFRKNGGSFERLRAYSLLFAVALCAVQLYWGNAWPVRLQLLVYSTTLFTGCMVCHGALYRLRPGPSRLTAYYLYISSGGVFGGIFSAIVAPKLFPDMWEYPLTWVGTAIFSLLLMVRGSDIAFWKTAKRRALGAVSLSCLIAVCCLFSTILVNHRDAAVSVRSFFGRLAVSKFKDMSCLYHGTIRHGCQWRDPEKSLRPTTYFGPDSGVGVSVRALRARQEDAPDKALRIGVAGLGIGTSAAWGKKGDFIRFFEIDPAVKDLAEQHFTYLSRAEASVEVVLGDARVSLYREETDVDAPLYDLLVIDAFSGDAVPLHLLTKEAAELYWRRLKKNGALAVHISNRYLDLEPLLFGLSDALKKSALLIYTDDEMKNLIYGSTWVVMTDDQALEHLIRALVPVAPPPEKAPLVFTDRYSNLTALL